MIAFRYDDRGALFPCRDCGHQFREQGLAPMLLTLPPPRSKRERRAMARRGRGHGRRKAVHVVEVEEKQAPMSMQIRVMVGHRFGNSDGARVTLYLPEGVSPTDDDRRRLDAIMRRR